MGTSDMRQYFETELKAVVLFAVTMAFFVQPLLPFFQPTIFFSTGCLLAVSITAFHSAFNNGKPSQVFIGVITLLCGAGLFLWGAIDALDQSRALRVQCEILQKKMMNGSPARINLAEIYQAWGCKPHF